MIMPDDHRPAMSQVTAVDGQFGTHTQHRDQRMNQPHRLTREEGSLPKDLDTNRSVMPHDHRTAMPQVTAVDEQFGTHRMTSSAPTRAATY
jgi:hypothetical protein